MPEGIVVYSWVNVRLVKRALPNPVPIVISKRGLMAVLRV